MSISAQSPERRQAAMARASAEIEGVLSYYDTSDSISDPKLNNSSLPETYDTHPHLHRRRMSAARSKVRHLADKVYNLPYDVAERLVTAIQAAWRNHRGPAAAMEGRDIPIDISNDEQLQDSRTHKPYRNNSVSSSIYSVYDFLPRQLFYQFSKLANIYFLFVSILQMIPSWSTTGTYTTIIPLMIFVSISIFREGYDDYCRHKQDKEENTRKCLVVRPSEDGKGVTYDERAWQKIKVGDVIRVLQNEWIPADIVLLHSSGLNGQTYVETMALDGETNLKTKDTPKEAQESFTVDNLSSIQAQCLTEDPNLDLYSFRGSMTVNGQRLALDNNNVIYRGSVLRNTASCFGLVVFTGEETKIRKNASENSRTKAPKLQAKVNRIVVLMAIFVLLLAGICTVISQHMQKSREDSYWYLQDLQVGIAPNLMGFIIMFNTLIPLSLYVSLEISKLLQLFHMQNDIDMYDPVSDTPCKCQTASLNEELGQVSYIFTDKTGTLTENVMVFRKLSVAGHPFIHDLDLITEEDDAPEEIPDGDEYDVGDALVERSNQRIKKKYLFHDAHEIRGASVDLISQMAALPRSSFAGPQGREPSFAREHKVIQERMSRASRASRSSMGRLSTSRPSMGKPRPSGHAPSESGSQIVAPVWQSSSNPVKPQTSPSTLSMLQYIMTHPNSAFSHKAKFFLLSLSLCHSATPEKELASEGSDVDIEFLDYQAASPDELALVSAARDLGYLVIDRQYNTITIRTYPHGFDKAPVDEHYAVLDTIEFTSNRKRMSVITKFPDGSICVLTKGADNVMIERLRNSFLGVAIKKADEIKETTALRKSIEADIVLGRKSMASDHSGSQIPPRSSFAGNVDAAYLSLDQHLQSAYDDQFIQEAGRRSMQGVRRSSLEASRARGVSHKRSVSGGSSIPARQQTAPVPVPAPAPAPASTSAPAKKLSGEQARVAFDSAEPDEQIAVNERAVLEKTLEHIDEFSTEGLRTLMYGHRFITQAEYDEWKTKYEEARNALDDREAKLEEVGGLIERDYEITGASAIEDKLQFGVPEAIDKLRRANIKLWMLTGDKSETAINIGYSCRLIKDYSTVVVLKGKVDLSTKVLATIEELERNHVAHCVVVVDGQTLAHIESDVALFSLFIDLGLKADSVIVCRASPAQKAIMVSQVRARDPKKVTLAIGDGANDIAMIKNADLGIGIAGKEGLQAARSSDYSIAQFRFLIKLLLVHGRWNYVRTCKYILGTFYKEFIFYMAQLVFQRNTLLTGTSLFESWSISMFNTLFTSLPVICLGVLDQELSATVLIAVPELYAKGQHNDSFNFDRFIAWLVAAMCNCVMICFMTFALWGENYGILDNSLFPISVVAFTVIVFIVNAKLLYFSMLNFTVINVICAAISIGGYLLWNVIIGGVGGPGARKVYYTWKSFTDYITHELNYWACILVIAAVCFYFELVVKYIRQLVKPSETDTFQVLERDPHIRQRLEREAEMELRAGWDFQAALPTGWDAIKRLKWPASPPQKPPKVSTSRPRRRDYWAAKLKLRNRVKHYDDEIRDILARRDNLV